MARIVYALIFVGSFGGFIADMLLYPRWWIAGPLVLVLTANILWGIAETS